METATASKISKTSQNSTPEKVPVKSLASEEIWRPIHNFRTKQRLSAMDYAVREIVKKQLTGHLSFHMDTLVEKGLTYEELLEIQKELELCPSVLQFYPGKQTWLTRLWQKLTLFLGLF